MLRNGSNTTTGTTGAGASSSALPNASVTPSLYLKQSADLLRQLKEKKGKNLEDLSNLLESICDKFPGTHTNIIHNQHLDEYKLFSKAVVDAIASKYDATSDQFHKFSQTREKNNQCVEATIIQSIAKLRIPMGTQRNSSLGISFKDIMIELLARTTRYFHYYPLQNHLTFTLAALTNIDINFFKSIIKARTVLDKDQVVNVPIDSFIQSAVRIIDGKVNDWPADTLIRCLHSIIILSAPEHGFANHIAPALAKRMLDKIASCLSATPAILQNNVSLAQQLFQIRNIYPNEFPPTLSAAIAPFISVFNANTHGSAFENVMLKRLQTAARSLKPTYGALIKDSIFAANNPICEALGLESDITYEDGFIKTCIQVDGDKYHKYAGSKETTQKTLLRDHCFKQDNWELINLTDGNSTYSTVEQFLIDAVIMPSFEARVATTLDTISAYQKMDDSALLALSDIESHREKLRRLQENIFMLKKHTLSYATYQEILNLSEFANNIEQMLVDIDPAFIAAQLNTQIAEFNLLEPVKLKNLRVHLNEANQKIASFSSKLQALDKEKVATKEKRDSLAEEKSANLAKIKEINAQIPGLKKQSREAQRRLDDVLAKQKQLDVFVQSTDKNKVKPEGLPSRQELKAMESSIKNVMSDLVSKESKFNQNIRDLESRNREIEHHKEKFDAQISKILSDSKENEALHEQFMQQKQQYEAALKSAGIADLIAHIDNNAQKLLYFSEQVALLDDNLKKVNAMAVQFLRQSIANQKENATSNASDTKKIVATTHTFTPAFFAQGRAATAAVPKKMVYSGYIFKPSSQTIKQASTVAGTTLANQTLSVYAPVLGDGDAKKEKSTTKGFAA